MCLSLKNKKIIDFEYYLKCYLSMNIKLGISSICLQLLYKNTTKANYHANYEGNYKTNESHINDINLMWQIDLFW